MNEAIGQSLPVAVGVLVSPMPIVAVVLMLTSRKAAANGTAFLLGWLVGIAAVGAVVLLAAGAATPSGDGPPSWVGVVKLVLGVLALLLAVTNWRKRPRQGTEPPTPRWMTAIDAFTPARSLGLGALLGAVNPKNLLLVVSGAAAIAGATSDSGAQAVALAVFVVVASLGVAAPIVLYVVLGSRAAPLLDDLKTWMVHNNAAILAVLLLVIGANLVGDGISAL